MAPGSTNQTHQLLITLKSYLKARGLTYKDIARKMGLSETSVKRLFSQETFTVSRLEALCREVDLELYDLVLMTRKRTSQGGQKLTPEQERSLVSDPRLLFFFYFLANGWSVDDIVTDYEISQTRAQQHLFKLDSLKLIELHEHNRFRLLVSSNVFWNRDGPLWNRYQERFERDLLDHTFDMPNERLVLCPAVLTPESIRVILRKVDTLVRQVNELAELDSALPPKQRHSTGLLIGFRPWVYRELAELRRR